jgi:hypothetical protein
MPPAQGHQPLGFPTHRAINLEKRAEKVEFYKLLSNSIK